MSKKRLIVHVASEVEPYSKTGGLGNVLGSLPKAHKELGEEVIIITPFYEQIIDTKEHAFESLGEAEYVEVTEGLWKKVSYRRTVLDDSVPVYFVESDEFFGPNEKAYGLPNDNARFMYFNVAALHLLKKLVFQPDVIHCHDWHTGLIPYFLKDRYKKDPFWQNTSTLFTIHNLTYQLGHNWWDIPADLRDDGHSALPRFDNTEWLERVNFAKRAILNADAINAVSETYREEIMTKDFGQELHRILKNREKIVFGIVNGIDYNEFNPLTDPGLFKHFSEKSVFLKKNNKRWLQKYYKLNIDPDVPLFCMTSRVTEQKGFKLVCTIIKIMINMGVQVIVMGDGDESIISSLQKVQKDFPRQIVVTPFDQEKETMVYAGSDMFLLPSRFEPCGINQLIALRYGCIPIVHHIGGLADTIMDYDPRSKTGNGFTFKRFGAVNLLMTVVRAVETFKHKRAWKELTIRGLHQANSWIIPAMKYIDLYETTIKLKKRNERKRKK